MWWRWGRPGARVKANLVKVETGGPYVTVQPSDVAVRLFDEGHAPHVVALVTVLLREDLVGRETARWGALGTQRQEGTDTRRDEVVFKLHTRVVNNPLQRGADTRDVGTPCACTAQLSWRHQTATYLDGKILLVGDDHSTSIRKHYALSCYSILFGPEGAPLNPVE